MRRSAIERRLSDVSERLTRAREELAVAEEQLQALEETAEETRIRSLVSETPQANREYQEARRHADAMARSRQAVEATAAELMGTMDSLLAQRGASTT